MTNDTPKAATADHVGNVAIERAANWLATTRRRRIVGPIVTVIQQRFALDASEAREVIRRVNIIRARVMSKGRSMTGINLFRANNIEFRRLFHELAGKIGTLSHDELREFYMAGDLSCAESDITEVSSFATSVIMHLAINEMTRRENDWDYTPPKSKFQRDNIVKLVKG